MKQWLGEHGMFHEVTLVEAHCWIASSHTTRNKPLAVWEICGKENFEVCGICVTRRFGMKM